jgi:hypothetical protein
VFKDAEQESTRRKVKISFNPCRNGCILSRDTSVTLFQFLLMPNKHSSLTILAKYIQLSREIDFSLRISKHQRMENLPFTVWTSKPLQPAVVVFERPTRSRDPGRFAVFFYICFGVTRGTASQCRPRAVLFNNDQL